MAGDKRRLSWTGKRYLGQNKIGKSLMKRNRKEQHQRLKIMFMLWDTPRQIIDDIAPYTLMEEMRPAT